jgi:D-galactarolactone cycloisomerase
VKITRVEGIPLRIPFGLGREPVAFGTAYTRTVDILLVRVDTDEGITGWGEAFGYDAVPASRTVLDTLVTPLVLGRDASAIEPLMAEAQRALQYYGRYGITVFALSGVDIALWDIAARVAGLPLYQLLGGAHRETLQAYACLPRFADPGAVAEQTREVLRQGYRYVKLHEDRAAEIEAARRAAGDGVPIMVDVNCAWTPEEAIAALGRLRELDLYWIEEPVWPPEDFHGLRRVREATGLTIAAGENACTAWEFRAMIEARAVILVQPSVTKVGGITEFLAVARLAERAGVDLAPHSPVFGPGFLAALHLAAACDVRTPVEHSIRALEANLYGEAARPISGRFHLPQQPGLGPDPDPDVVRRYRIA